MMRKGTRQVKITAVEQIEMLDLLNIRIIESDPNNTTPDNINIVKYAHLDVFSFESYNRVTTG
jgi:hypothetical protein